jgi:glyceraldehyde-3-phosphate dehydrogenase/erythrose-4-phosphate dehydrogenase
MRIVHVVGTGTIGEPLIGLLADNKEHFGIDEVTFHKRTPLITERAKVNDLVDRGAVLCVDDDRRSTFEEIGHAPKYSREEAIERASVVIDCTPVGNEQKEEFYDKARGPMGFMAQGSEDGFGKKYARGVNDEALVRGEDRFLQIVSCNTHNIAVLVKSLAMDEDGTNHLEDGRFLCIRRANDI